MRKADQFTRDLAKYSTKLSTKKLNKSVAKYILSESHNSGLMVMENLERGWSLLQQNKKDLECELDMWEKYNLLLRIPTLCYVTLL